MLRAYLVLLGIPYHVAFLYAAKSDWVVADLVRSDLLEHLTATIHSFRIPAFFIVAGYFTSLVLMRRTEAVWMRSRLRQVGIPLISSIVLIMPITMLLTAFADPSTPQMLPVSVAVQKLEMQLLTFGTHWIAHLWFLVVLLQFCFLIFFSWKYIQRINFGKFDLFVSDHFLLMAFLLGLGALVYHFVRSVLNVIAMRFISQDVLVAIYFSPFLAYFPFFLLGLALQMMPLCFERFRRFNWWVLAGTIVIIALFDASHAERTALEKFVNRLAFAFAGIGVTSVGMSLFLKWFNTENKFVARVIDLALIIYIVHFPIVMGLGLLARQADYPILLEYVIITVMAFGLSFAVARCIIFVRPLRFLFTGAR